MNDGHLHDDIVRLESQIDEVADKIESCRKFILAGRFAVVGGGVFLIPTLLGARARASTWTSIARRP
jgi:hypothetical protein